MDSRGTTSVDESPISVWDVKYTDMGIEGSYEVCTDVVIEATFLHALFSKFAAMAIAMLAKLAHKKNMSGHACPT